MGSPNKRTASRMKYLRLMFYDMSLNSFSNEIKFINSRINRINFNFLIKTN
jgi:hypothetical protein